MIIQIKFMIQQNEFMNVVANQLGTINLILKTLKNSTFPIPRIFNFIYF